MKSGVVPSVQSIAADRWSQHARRREISGWLMQFYEVNGEKPPMAKILLLPVRPVEHVVLDTAPCGTVPSTPDYLIYKPELTSHD